MRVDADHGEIGIEIRSDQLGVKLSGGSGQGRLDSVGFLHNVIVGENVSIGIDDHARAQGLTLAALRLSGIPNGLLGPPKNFLKNSCIEESSPPSSSSLGDGRRRLVRGLAVAAFWFIGRGDIHHGGSSYLAICERLSTVGLDSESPEASLRERPDLFRGLHAGIVNQSADPRFRSTA
jgi:hypothetical protein